MWDCPVCGRNFKKTKQLHSCKTIPLAEHFKGKEKAKELFDFLVEDINKKIGKTKNISLPCCIHLFGVYDFLAVLPKENGIEVRFALDRILHNSRLKVSIPLSRKTFKNCFEIHNSGELDKEFVGWLKESYFLKI